MATVGVDLGGYEDHGRAWSKSGKVVEQGEAGDATRRRTSRGSRRRGRARSPKADPGRRRPRDRRGRARARRCPAPVCCLWPANLSEWTTDVDVAAELSTRLDGREVAVDNDVNVATLAEHRFGAAARGATISWPSSWGPEWAPAWCSTGRVRRGPNAAWPGEIGHSFVDFHDFGLDNDLRGELEDYAGRRAMERRALSRPR